MREWWNSYWDAHAARLTFLEGTIGNLRSGLQIVGQDPVDQQRNLEIRQCELRNHRLQPFKDCAVALEPLKYPIAVIGVIIAILKYG